MSGSSVGESHIDLWCMCCSGLCGGLQLLMVYARQVQQGQQGSSLGSREERSLFCVPPPFGSGIIGVPA